MAASLQLDTLNLSAVDEFGVEWSTDNITGWGSPGVTLQLTQKPRAHGAWGSASFLTPRVLGPTGSAVARDPAAAVDAVDRLVTAVGVAETKRFAVTEGGRTRWCGVQRSDEVLVTWLNDRAFQWSLDVTAKDPRKYGEFVTPPPTGLPSSSGGLTWPVTWPITWSGVNTSGVIHIDNPGNIPTPVRMRVDGPINGLVIRHDSSGAELVLSAAYTLGVGSFLAIDNERRTVLEGGTASRNGWITSRGWFYLDPGPNDIIFDSLGAYTPGAALTLSYAPAWG